MPHVLVTDSTFEDLELERAILAPLGCKLDSRQCRTAGELADAVRAADYVLTQFAPVDGRVIAAMERARLIVRYGIGVDNVDLAAARGRGIPVCNVPDYCIDEVADHTLALILATTRQLVLHDREVHEGRWKLAAPLAAMRALRDLTIGVVGCGRIGGQVIRRLIPFGCRVVAFDPAISPGSLGIPEVQAAGSLAELFSASDVLTLHCPSTPQTRGMVNAYAIALLRPGSIVINASRGDLVDTEALLTGLRSGRVSAAALDVCDTEPIPPGHPILGLPGVILSPHIASTSPRAVRALREGAAGLVARAVRGEPLINVVNGIDRPRPC
jgi:D-3-phosphoglycerate dehydrogenase